MDPKVALNPAASPIAIMTASVEPTRTSKSINAASARDPIPAISRSSVTCSGVST
jgi:hypothetical protein